MKLRSSCWPVALALALGTVSPGWARTVVDLDTTSFLPPSPLSVPLKVAVHHPSELRAYKRVWEYELEEAVYPVGEATVKLFDQVYQTVFQQVVAADDRPTSSRPAPGVDAVIDTNIEELRFDWVRRARNYYCWSEVVYRFTAYSPVGEVVASWTVRGQGERASMLVGVPLHRVIGQAMELAMREAASRFATSFLFVPEAKRWRMGLPAAGGTALQTGQTTESGERKVTGSYSGVVSASAEWPRAESFPDILSTTVRVTNLGRQKLFVRPADASLTVADGTRISVASAGALVMATVPRQYRPLLVQPGQVFPPGAAPGVGMIPGLISAFIHLEANAVEESQAEAVLARYRAEGLKDVTLWEGEGTEFVAHFLVRPDGGGFTLVLPVIDLDAATRYVVSLPAPR